MPGLSFVYPQLLWLLGLLVGLWGLALLAPRRLPPWRHYGSLALRSLILAALVLAVAGAQADRPVQRVATVFLLDASDSVAPTRRAQAELFVRDALAAMGPDDRAALVLFGGDALVERAPSEARTLGAIAALPRATSTDIGGAIQLGLALLPADAQQRIVLLSDGGENAGDAAAAARLAAARGVPIDLVDLSFVGGPPDALALALHAPAAARDGQELTLEAVVASSVAQPAELRLLRDGALLETRSVALQPGETRVAFATTARGSGFQQFSLELVAADDAVAQNNVSAAMVQVQGPPRLLLVATADEDARALATALAAAKMLPEIVSPDAMPTDLAGLGAYEAVLLVNVPARALPVAAMAALPSYVRDLGRGLLMIGGEHSFGVGGYGDTPVEEALPVYMHVRDRVERPDLAIVFVIDKSGSMDACHCASPDVSAPIGAPGSSQRKVDIAKEAVAQAAGLLGARDTVGVITFDRAAYDTLPATRGASVADVAAAMADLQPRGATNVREGLVAAQEMLAGVDARLKHVILLTDGWGGGGSGVDRAVLLQRDGITLSVVAAGGGSAGHLATLAERGGGRFYDVADMGHVPQIFVQETISTIGNYIVERPFAPVAVGESPVLAGLGGLPTLYGFNGSTIKERARTLLATDDAQPLLATWQFGLGRSAAWLSDTKGQWAADWLAWPQFPRFAAQLAAAVLPARGGLQPTAETILAGGEATLRLTLDPQLVAGDGLAVTATLVGADGSRQELALPQRGPAVYQAQIARPQPGTYIVQVAGAAGERLLLQESAALVVPYAAEYGAASSNPALLASVARLTGGAPLAAPGAAFAPTGRPASEPAPLAFPLLLLALALLPLDILIRRISVRRA